MRRVIEIVTAVMCIIGLSPAAVFADTISVSQIITITATVAPARSIIVNDQGQMTKIYSNTAENVAPKVYLNDVPGEPRPLNADLLQQYNSVISQQKNLVGVAIPVAQPVAKLNSVKQLFSSSVSLVLRPLSF